MRRILGALLVILVPVVVVLAQAPPPGDGQTLYNVEIDNVISAVRDVEGRKALCVTVRFHVKKPGDDRAVTGLEKGDRILVEEDGRRVAELEIQPQREAGELAVDLALDVSGSMTANGSPKLAEARRAARGFLERLDPRVRCGLVLFNHQVVEDVPPGRDRQRLGQLIDDAEAVGGTAYLDATYRAVEQVSPLSGRKAVLVMTDGVDLNSRRSLTEVIEHAVRHEVRVFTVGVGEPGKNEPVTTVLVLDRSGSMREPTPVEEGGRSVSKLEALKDAASRFVDIMRPGARTTLLPFNNEVATPKPFGDNQAELKRGINALEPKEGTALFDATYQALVVLQEADPPGKRAVVVLTDGMDTSSNRSVEAVIKKARETGTPLHMLGLGRDQDIDRTVMRRMGDETHGSFHHVKSHSELVRIFEQLSIDLHDEGIDEATLKELAEKTGGKYFLARDVSNLHLHFLEVAQELESTFEITYVSPRSVNDGTARAVDVSVWRQGARIGGTGGDQGRKGYAVRGVLIPDMDPGVYLGLLAVLVVVLAVPSAIRALYRFYGGT